MFNKKLIVFVSILVLAAGIGFSGCAKKESAAGKKEITILYPNWAEGVAITFVTKAALEEKGYKVKAKGVDVGIIYASLGKGDADLMMDAWLPHTHKHYWEKYGKNLEKLGLTSKEGGSTGLVVPSYVEENSIEDLNAAKDKYDGKIIGIGSGSGIHKNTLEAIKSYGLDFKQITSSGPAMVAALEKAYRKKEPIVITGWKPHHKWAKFDLKYLKDPKKIYPVDEMTIIARKGFKDEQPEIAKFMANFNLPKDTLYDLLDAYDKGKGDPAKACKAWYLKNKDLVDGFWK